MAEKRLDLIIRGRDQASGVLKGVGGALGVLRSRALALTTALTGGGVVAGLAALTRNSLEQIDAQAKMADRLGDTIDNLRGLSFAGELAGVAQEEMTRALDTFAKRMGEAEQGVGQGVAALENLGIRFDEIRGKSPTEQLLRVADAMKQMQSATLRADATSDLFGRGAVEMNNLLMQGSAAIREQIGESIELRGAISRIDAGKVEALNDEWSRFKTTLSGLGDTIAVELADPLRRVVETLAEGVPWVRRFAEALGDAAAETERIAKLIIDSGLSRLFGAGGEGVMPSVAPSTGPLDPLGDAVREIRASLGMGGLSSSALQDRDINTFGDLMRAIREAGLADAAADGNLFGVDLRQLNRDMAGIEETRQRQAAMLAESRANDLEAMRASVYDFGGPGARMLEQVEAALSERARQDAFVTPEAIAQRAAEQVLRERGQIPGIGMTFSEREALDEVFRRSREHQFGAAMAETSRQTPTGVNITDRFTAAAHRFQAGQLQPLKELVAVEKEARNTQKQLAEDMRALLKHVQNSRGGIPLNLGGG